MTQFTDERSRGRSMTPEVFAKTIISIEHNYGLKLDARSVWLRMDAIACGKGWVGTKPGCKRAGKVTAAPAAKGPEIKPDQPEVLKAKPEGTIVKAKTRAKKAIAPKVEPKVEPVKPVESPIVAKSDPRIKKSEDVDVKKATDENGSPKEFSTTIGKNQIVMHVDAPGTHSPTWSQNNDGISVSGNKSRRFIVNSHGDGDIYSMKPNQFKSFIEKVRQDPAYNKVEEFNLGNVWKTDNTKQGKASLKKLKDLEAAGLISLTGDKGSNFHGVIVNFNEKGGIRKATEAELNSIPLRAKVFDLRESQAAMLEAEHSITASHKPDLKQIRGEEESLANKVVEAEDKLYGRRNTKTATEAEYITKAEAWAKSQGFKNDGDGVNGFSAKQAAKHDIAHPATHDLIGLDSAGINSYFGDLKTGSGKKSLLGEEAIVNVAEHLSRGDTLESAVMSGVRVARMLSRDSTKHEKDYVRSPKFLQDLNNLGERALKANNFGTIAKVIRQSNWDSGTVTRTGNT